MGDVGAALLIGAVVLALLYELCRLVVSPRARLAWIRAGYECWQAFCGDRSVLLRSAWTPHLGFVRWVGRLSLCGCALIGLTLLPVPIFLVVLGILVVAYLLDVSAHWAAQKLVGAQPHSDSRVE